MKRPNVECPNCGAEFPASRLACPECGSDAQTGWKSNQDIEYESVDLPEADADPDRPAPKKLWPTLAAVTIVLLIIALLIDALVL